MNSDETNDPTRDLTENLSDRQLLLLLLERVTGIDERVTGIDEGAASDRQLLLQVLERVARLEAIEEDRKLETRPLWARLEGQMTTVIAQLSTNEIRLSAVETRLSAIEEEQVRMRDEQRRMRAEIRGFREDMHGERRERFYMDERITELERAQQPPQ